MSAEVTEQISQSGKTSTTCLNKEIFETQLRRKSTPLPNVSEEPEKPNQEQLMRRRSTFKGIATSVKSLVNMRFLTKAPPRRISLAPSQSTKPTVKMENTYKMKPDDDKAANSDRLYQLISEILEKRLKNENYDVKTCGKFSCDLSTLIKQRVKSLNIPRYKFVCQVVIGQRCDQGMQFCSRCLWMPNTDTYQQVAYSNNSIYAIVTVFAVYFE